jgi:hypothetical protein
MTPDTFPTRDEIAKIVDDPADAYIIADALLARLREESYCWEMFRHPECRERFRAEINALRANLEATQKKLAAFEEWDNNNEECYVASHATLSMDLAHANAESDKLASTVLALDEEQIRLKADLRAVAKDALQMCEVGTRLFNELTKSVATLPRQPINDKLLGDLWHEFGSRKAECSATLARPGVQAARKETR